MSHHHQAVCTTHEKARNLMWGPWEMILFLSTALRMDTRLPSGLMFTSIDQLSDERPCAQRRTMKQ
eukprot:2936417-Amphidinium_carterae.1